MISLKLHLLLACFTLQSSGSSIIDTIAVINREVSILADIGSRSQSLTTLISDMLPNIFTGPKLTEDELSEMNNQIIYFEQLSSQLSGELQTTVDEFAEASRAFVLTMTDMNVHTDVASERSFRNTLALANFEPRMRRDLARFQRAGTQLITRVRTQAFLVQATAVVAAQLSLAPLAGVATPEQFAEATSAISHMASSISEVAQEESVSAEVTAAAEERDFAEDRPTRH